MSQSINIEILEGTGCQIYLTISNGGNAVDANDYDCYGAVSRIGSLEQFKGNATSESGQYLLVVPPLYLTDGSKWKLQVCVRKKTSGHEWRAIEGTIQVKFRYAEMDADKIAIPEYTANYHLDTGELIVAAGYLPIESGSNEPSNGDYLFFDTNGVPVSGKLDNLTYGRYMFTRNKLSSWNILMPSLEDGCYMFENCSAMTSFSSDLSNLTVGENMFLGCKLTNWNNPLPKLTNGSRMFQGCAELTSFCGDLSSLEQGNQLFYSCSKLTSFGSQVPKLHQGHGMFTTSRLDKESALRVLTSIPAYTDGQTHALTMGIHVDHKEDADVLTAIENAIARGWSLTVQYNGTASVQVASESRIAEKLWFKRIEDSAGNYIDESGTRYYIDWGNYIGSPEGENAELGYTPFATLEEALEEWKLNEYIQ